MQFAIDKLKRMYYPVVESNYYRIWPERER